MVGIGGGVPESVRLGDVVVSVPTDEISGMVQLNFGKVQQGGNVEHTESLNRPPIELITALTKLKVKHAKNGSKIPQYLKDLETSWPELVPKYARSESLRDRLFKSDYQHIYNSPFDEANAKGQDKGNIEAEEEVDHCIHCDQTKIIHREPRGMRVHHGLIASSNIVIKDALTRDKINTRLGGNVLCFEMGAAGLMDDFPCLVIRGICDYADSHRSRG
jgi:nucleoside phosphorylase